MGNHFLRYSISLSLPIESSPTPESSSVEPIVQKNVGTSDSGFNAIIRRNVQYAEPELLIKEKGSY